MTSIKTALMAPLRIANISAFGAGGGSRQEGQEHPVDERRDEERQRREVERGAEPADLGVVREHREQADVDLGINGGRHLDDAKGRLATRTSFTAFGSHVIRSPRWRRASRRSASMRATSTIKNVSANPPRLRWARIATATAPPEELRRDVDDGEPVHGARRVESAARLLLTTITSCARPKTKTTSLHLRRAVGEHHHARHRGEEDGAQPEAHHGEPAEEVGCVRRADGDLLRCTSRCRGRGGRRRPRRSSRRS